MKYHVNWHYKSSLANLERNQEIDLTPELASAINRDSPGVLSVVVLSVVQETVPEPEPQEEETTRAPEVPAQDRMYKGRKKRGVL